MAIAPGTRLGTFEIVDLLGVGGMGEVYRARDTKLGREVAIKVLPETVAEDPRRLARFEREAKLLAALDHANIAALHDFQHVDDTHFLVMQLVEGETLAERIRRGPVPLNEARPIFVQIARALEAAHDSGIVHRDLKPANIKISHDDNVKVLDFGIAKSLAGPEAPSTTTPTPSSPDATTLPSTPSPPASITGTEMLIGTPAYMSPEQARAKRVDKRTDIWAYGCCLYETLTGRKTFSGDGIADTIGSITRDEPDWDMLPKNTPPEVKSVIARCLRKDPARRLHHIADARIDLEESIAPGTRAQSPAVAGPSVRRQVMLLGALLLGALAVIGVLLFQQGLGTAPAPGASDHFELDAALSSAPKPVRRYSINLPKDMPLRPRGPITRLNMDISPDGTRLVYVTQAIGASRRLVVRRLNQQEPEALFGTEGGGNPFFSPDGQWIGFFVQKDRKLKKVSILGASPVTLCDATIALGASWGEDGYIYFQSEVAGGLRRISASGGEIEMLTTPDRDAGELFHTHPYILPGGEGLIFAIAGAEDISTARVALLNLETGEKEILADRAAAVGYAPTGHLLYIQAGALTALPFDLDSLAVIGPPVPVTEYRMADPGEIPRDVSISREGTLVFVPAGGESTATRTLVWVDRDGSEEQVSEATRDYNFARLSPDGTRLAVGVMVRGNGDIWVNDLSRGISTRLTFDSAWDGDPVWSPDGQHIVFQSSREGSYNLFRKPADGSGSVERLTTSPNFQAPFSWSPNGAELLYTDFVPGNGVDVFALPLERNGEPRAIFQGPFDEDFPALSRDGRWIAYTSNESGRSEIYVRPYPSLRGKWQISTDGGAAARWSGDGKELFYRSGSKVMVVTINTEPSFVPGNPVELFEGPYVPDPDPANYDVSVDGQRFVMVKRGQLADSTLPQTEIMVVENWFEELKRLAPPWEKQ